MTDEAPTVFVQRQVCITPPVSVATLRGFLLDLPADASVEILDGELIDIRWQRHEPHQVPS